MLVAEELVAMIAESGEKPSLFDKIQLAAKQEYSSQTGENIVYTDDDVRVLLQRGRDYLRSKAAFEPNADLSIRGPGALTPRQSKLNTLMKSMPDALWNQFDQHLLKDGQGTLDS